MSTARQTARVAPDDYLELVRRFPLRTIRDAGEHAIAEDVLGDLVAKGTTDAGLTDGERQYAEALLVLNRDYKARRPGGGAALPRPEPRETLAFLMEERGMRTTDLAKIVGKSTATEILQGKRQISKANVKRLAEYFKVGPALFL